MNKEHLDALGDLYLTVHGGEQLNEIGILPRGITPQQARSQSSNASKVISRISRGAVNALKDLPAATMSQLQGQGAVKSNDAALMKQRTRGENLKRILSGKETLDQRAERISKAQNSAIASAERAEKTPPRPSGSSPTTPVAAPSRPTGSPSPRPVAARPPGPVLSKKNGVEGTGVGANFKARAFTPAEKSRYASVAAQNAARSAASSGTPKPSSTTPVAQKPATPAIGKLGNTSFERRTPTSAELSAAQRERASQKALGQNTNSIKNAEKALQAAQKTNLSTIGPTPAVPSPFTASFSPRDMNKYPLKPNNINNTKPPTPKMQKQSYEWTSAKTLKDIAEAYQTVYEAKKKVDQDKDGDNDFADVTIARMIASGVPKEVAISKTKNKSYNKEEVELVDERYMGFKKLKASIASRGGVTDPGAVAASIGRKKYGKKRFQTAAAKGKKLGEDFSQAARGAQRGALTPKEKKQLNREAYETYEIVASYLLENNFASTIEDANAIINNMSENWFVQILEDYN